MEEIQTRSTDALKGYCQSLHGTYSDIRLELCATVDYFYNNVQEEPSLREQEIKKNRIQTTGTKTADPNKFKGESCQRDEFV